MIDIFYGLGCMFILVLMATTLHFFHSRHQENKRLTSQDDKIKSLSLKFQQLIDKKDADHSSVSRKVLEAEMAIQKALEMEKRFEAAMGEMEKSYQAVHDHCQKVYDHSASIRERLADLSPIHYHKYFGRFMQNEKFETAAKAYRKKKVKA